MNVKRKSICKTIVLTIAALVTVILMCIPLAVTSYATNAATRPGGVGNYGGKGFMCDVYNRQWGARVTFVEDGKQVPYAFTPTELAMFVRDYNFMDMVGVDNVKSWATSLFLEEDDISYVI